MVVEVVLSEKIELVSHVRLDQVVSDHGIEKSTLELDAVPAHDDVVVLDVLPYFFDVGIFKNSAKNLRDAQRRLPVCGDRHIVRQAFFPGERHAHELCRIGIHM